MLQEKATWCSEVLQYGEFYLLSMWGEGHKRVAGEGHHKGRERPLSCHKNRAQPSSDGIRGRPCHAWNGTVGTQRRITERGLWVPCTTCRISILTGDWNLSHSSKGPEPQNPWCQPLGPQGISLQRVFMTTLVRYGWMNCIQKSPNPAKFLLPFVVLNTDQRISLW